MPNRWLTSTEVAMLLRVRPATMSQWRWRKRGPAFVKLGPLVRYDEREVRKYMRDPAGYEARR